MGRSTVSCDNGLNWIQNQSLDDDARCWLPGGPECDHHPGSGVGVAYDRGTFVATYGWGYPGPVKTTSDGFYWKEIQRSYTTTGPAAGLERLVAFTFSPFVSDDRGQTWSENPSVYLNYNPRRVVFIPYGGGVFIVFTSSGANREVWRSTNSGETWTQATYPATCSGSFGGFDYGNGVAIMTGNLENGSYRHCRSLDGGQTWQPLVIPLASGDYFEGPFIFSNQKFIAFGHSYKYVSLDDGLTWASTALVTIHPSSSQPSHGPVSISLVASGSGGRLVAVSQTWGHYYAEQRFIYSDDEGTTWQDSQSYLGSHPITGMAYGAVEHTPPGCRN